jgi:hypothetical protein
MIFFRKTAFWTVAIWTGFFAIFVVPLTSLYEMKVARWPVVTAQVSNPRLERVSNNGRYELFVTLDFDRPTKDGVVRCHLDRYLMGAEVRAWTLQVAVHPDSCYEPVRLPLRAPSDFLAWALIYLAGCVASVMLALWIALRVPRTYYLPAYPQAYAYARQVYAYCKGPDLPPTNETAPTYTNDLTRKRKVRVAGRGG